MAVGFLQRERIIAPPGWSRWLIPPAALSIHLAIGQAYAWSVFKNPLAATMLQGNPAAGTLTALPFTLGIVMLGVSAAVFGTAVDRNGPRWAMFISMVCFSTGFLVSALGVSLGQYWMVILGYGVIGGIGLGIGYISPVSTLIKWFPDRPGMATGLAIMGFGGGALIASPWSASMLGGFGATGENAQASGVALAFLVHGVVYAVFMSVGWLLVRVPPDGWHPAGWHPSEAKTGSLITTANVSANNAIRTPQFWLLWVVLCFNVTAGIGILERASPIFQDYFPDAGTEIAAAAAGFVAILSLSNMVGRIVWSSTSDLIGRKNIYRVYLGVGALLYLLITLLGNANQALFLIASMLILSFYGAGFATVPAYLRDLFGTYQVGAIHGRLLTAWSTAGVLGPVIVNAIADAQIAAGVQGPGRYTLAFSIMIGLLVIGFICNELIRPVNERYHEPTGEQAIRTTGAQAA
ncbi:nitrate/nitrite transporter NarK [Pseudonocardia hierapolitana]|uniref:Nitrate/nitrite transporter NarK n=1 Tax=Pseudonocardia hierapolitana TaxID=1128676 RepID=A0A561SM04_9PSEU|nr:OFA family MFS transporter [Pseudonocardia hierapolitana]TWF75862.1 nitrate/nitrite transporter NarK [Pseudonocardia hierapolitana]